MWPRLAFYEDAQIQTQVFMLSQQCSYPFPAIPQHPGLAEVGASQPVSSVTGNAA